jgi:hypothetical protein
MWGRLNSLNRGVTDDGWRETNSKIMYYFKIRNLPNKIVEVYSILEYVQFQYAFFI